MQPSAQHIRVSLGPEWQNPRELPPITQPAEPFEADLLETPVRDFVTDTAERLQCPADFIAIPVMIGLSSLIGRNVRISPKAHDSWLVVPNLWGAVVGPPSAMKTPALKAALAPLHELERAAAESYQMEMDGYQIAAMAWEASRKNAAQALQQAAKNGGNARRIAEECVDAEPAAPVCRRYIVNDTTTEKLGEILNENRNGVLLFRDEAMGFLRSLDKQGRESDRAFYLEAWNGDNSFTFDRISRGTKRVETACVSFVSGIQPGPLDEYLRAAVSGGKGDDGLLQRFQLLVWPEPQRTFENIDRAPNIAAYRRYNELCGWLTSLEGGEHVVGFTAAAQAIFDQWRLRLENRLRSAGMPPALEAHVAKYRSLIPSLALIHHLSHGQVSDVPEEPLLRAIAWGDYLESHARRMYSETQRHDLRAAHALLRKIQGKVIADRFTLRDVYRAGWARLASRDAAQDAVDILMDHEILASRSYETPGRSKTEYLINPEVLNESA